MVAALKSEKALSGKRKRKAEATAAFTKSPPRGVSSMGVGTWYRWKCNQGALIQPEGIRGSLQT